jgi:hypothetical protein
VSVFLVRSNAADSSCFALADGVHADLNGAPLALSDHGGQKSNRSGAEFCTTPRFDSTQVPTGAPSNDVLTISDSSATWTMAVSNFAATRTVGLDAPADGSVRAGDWVTLASEPPDAVNLASVAFFSDTNPTTTDVAGDPAPEFRYDEIRAAGGSTGQVVEFDGNRFRFAMRTAPSGAAHVDGKIGVTLPVQRCDGPRACEVNLEHEFSGIPLSVAP